jgi:MFS family permease
VLLLVLSSLTTVAIILFLPETLRSIAGNGSIRLEGIYQPLIRYLKHHSKEQYANPDTDPDIMPRRRVTRKTFTEPLKLLIRKDIILNLLFGGVVYAIWSMVTASTTPLFKGTFALNELQIGLAFLPNGIGTIVGSAITAKLMTVDFLAAEAKYAAKHNLPLDYKLPKKDLPTDFPIEHARLRRLTSITILFVSSLALYGLSLAFSNLTARNGWIAVPLILQFLIAAASNAVFALNQTLLADLCPGRGASATAINNLVRCSLGAIGVALVDMIIAGVGVGAAFASLALFVLVCAPLPVVNWYWGQQWRVETQEKVTERKSEA